MIDNISLICPEFVKKVNLDGLLINDVIKIFSQLQGAATAAEL